MPSLETTNWILAVIAAASAAQFLMLLFGALWVAKRVSDVQDTVTKALTRFEVTHMPELSAKVANLVDDFHKVANRMDHVGQEVGALAAQRLDHVVQRVAGQIEADGRQFLVQEVDLEEPRAGEVLVRLTACGVCHTDLYTASGADPSGYAPTVLGHEGAGIVEKLGPDVTSLAPGDQVVTLFSPQCRECIHCLSERTNLCLAIRDMQGKGFLPDGTTRLGRDGAPIRRAAPPDAGACIRESVSPAHRKAIPVKL